MSFVKFSIRPLCGIGQVQRFRTGNILQMYYTTNKPKIICVLADLNN